MRSKLKKLAPFLAIATIVVGTALFFIFGMNESLPQKEFSEKLSSMGNHVGWNSIGNSQLNISSMSRGAPSNGDFLTNSPPQNEDKAAKGSSRSLKGSVAGDYGAFAAFGEVGYKNFRASGSYGVYFTSHQRFKVTAEWLTQKLKYHFALSPVSKWVSQYAAGLEYQYLFCHSLFQSIDLGTSYVHAFSRDVSTKQIDSNETIKRHIAGSDGSLSFLGTTAKLWNCAYLSAAANYDWVKYHRKYESEKLTNGFGGSVSFVQQFARDFSLTLGADFRQPFNFYQGILNWNRLFSCWGIDLGIYGNITDGKKGTPDIKTIGLQVGISFGGKGTKCPCPRKASSKECYSRAYCDVAQWVSTPAVYVPVVLTVADQELTELSPFSCDGLGPTATITFIDINNDNNNDPISTPMAGYIVSSLPVTYSLDMPGLEPGNTASVDANGNILSMSTGMNFQPLVVGTLTVTSSCGSVQIQINMSFGTG